MKRKIKYSREQIQTFEYFYSDIKEIVNTYFFFKSILTISVFITTTIAIGFIMCNRDENIRKLIKPEPVIITMLIITLICFKVLNKFQNEAIYDYLNEKKKKQKL